MSDVAKALEGALPHVARSGALLDRTFVARDLWPRLHLGVREGRIAPAPPAVVAWPERTEEVAELVSFAAREGIPVVPFGAGSGVCGGVFPDPRAILLDLKRMERWRALDEGAPSLDVEAGALGLRLEEDLQARGFTAGHFPSSILCSTVGGWLAARGAGQCSGRYGKIEDMVASLELVTGAGEVVRLRRRTGARGVDLVPFVIGSEGVLGVITAAELRLHPSPAERAFTALSFPTTEAGWTTMRDVFQAGIRPAVARLYDPFDSFIARQKKGNKKERERGPDDVGGAHVPGRGAALLRRALGRPDVLNALVEAASGPVLRGSTLVFVFEGQGGEPQDDAARAEAIARRHGARLLGEGPARHWLDHRYSVSYRQAPVFMGGAFGDTMEVAAPWSKLGALYDGVRAALGRHVFVMAHLSHAYPDGCSIYFTFAGSAPTSAEMEARYDRAWQDAMSAALAAGGTLSHHHGVGRSKAPRLGEELGAGVDVVRAAMRVFDPQVIMNPGNLLPKEVRLREVAGPPAEAELDRESLLVRVRGDATLGSVEAMLARHGLGLGLAQGTPLEETVDGWIADGLPGAPDAWDDPVDHEVAGFTARLRSGVRVEVRPGPRRAVGPDLFALFAGAEGRAGTIESAWLRARDGRAARPLACRLARAPGYEPGEAELAARVLGAVAGG